MPKYRITHLSGDPEEITANGYRDSEDHRWIDFYKSASGSKTNILRVRSDDVQRIEEVEKAE